MITYQATQLRPNYWDGARVERQNLSDRSGDWRMSYTLVARELDSLEAAEKYARRILGQRPGVPVELYRDEPHGKRTHVATVSRDALGRTWTDIQQWEALL